METSIKRKHIRALKKRLTWLQARIDKNKDTHLSYDNEEAAALRWALYELKQKYPELIAVFTEN